MKIEKKIIPGLPNVNLKARNYVIAHETANPTSTIDGEVSNMTRNWPSAFVTHFVGGGGRVIQVAPVGKVSWGCGNGNAFSYAQVELCRAKDKATFQKDYAVYCQLLVDLAREAGLPTTLDTAGKGIKSHDWVREHLGGTTHTDPYGYLTQMGISKAQFAKDLAKAASGSGKPSSKDKYFDFAPGAITITKPEGAGAYHDKELTKKVKHYKKGTKLTIKSVVKVGNVYRFLTIHGSYITANKAYVKVWNEPSKYKLKAQKGTFLPNTIVAVKKDPTVKAKRYSTRKKGDSVSYSGYIEKDGYIWIAFHTKAGTLYYMAVRDAKTGKAFGTFK
ncbi:DUF5776 domain-containing protein [Listeria grayi]|uniref:DUF5776 domain-containing protein n=1 Tax=Listeria grayi TaxID=1641 RepID=UPI0016256E91|nr:DUF5776 domain-containing protein [Listeria grayi]MBC1921986.1 hypothetical protein [Listeria grayi]